MGVMSEGHTNDSDLCWMGLDTGEMDTGSECGGGEGYVVWSLELHWSGVCSARNPDVECLSSHFSPLPRPFSPRSSSPRAPLAPCDWLGLTF